MATDRKNMSGRQRRQITRLSKIHGYGSRHSAIADALGVSRRQARRHRLTDFEAAAVIRSLAPGTSMANASGHDASYRPWILGSLGVALVALIVAQTYWWGWLVLVLALVLACYLSYRAVREFIGDHFWRASRAKRKERFGTQEVGYDYEVPEN